MKRAGLRPIGLTVCLSTSLIASAAAHGGAPATWNFDLQTSGNDVFWTSPTAIDPAADGYVATLRTTLVEARVRYLFFEFTVDVTDQIPPEFLESTEEGDGPAPATFASKPLVFPEPPEPPAVAGTLNVALNAAGFGQVSFTDVTLGTALVEIPGFGMQTVQIRNVRFAGNVTVDPVFFLTGDMNCDGLVSVADIGPFVLGLTDPTGYAAQFPACDALNGDTNNDGLVSVSDIGGFVALLTGA